MSAEDKHSHDVNLVIVSGGKELPFTFPKTTKVSEVIAKAVEAFHLATQGERFDLFLATDLKTPLMPERTLESYHIADGTKLILTAAGGGV